MVFQPGQSGNPAGRPKGTDESFRKMLDKVFTEKGEIIEAKLVEKLDDVKMIRWLCEQKASFELKAMPNKVEGNVGVDAFVSNILDKLGTNDDKSQA